MGYWSEMNINGFVFNVSVDGVILPRELDTENPQSLAVAAFYAIAIYKRVYPVVEALNCGQHFYDERSVVKYLPWFGDTKPLIEAKEYIDLLRQKGASITLPDEIDRVVVTAWARSQSPRQSGISGYVYLLRSSTGYWKIGKTKNPDSRLKTFGVMLPFEVEYEHLIPCEDHNAAEYSLHQRFEANRVNGEWFNLSADDVTYIKSISYL